VWTTAKKAAAVTAKADACGVHKDKATCDVSSSSGCAWYEQKNLCYTAASKTPGTQTTKTGTGGACNAIANQTACTAASASSCKWYGNGKNVCYEQGVDDKADTTKVVGFSGAGTQDASVYQWWVQDELVAPSKAGHYILQWRWDNEQTPQVWTTCADIEVTNVTSPSASSSVAKLGASMMLQVMLLAVAAFSV